MAAASAIASGEPGAVDREQDRAVRGRAGGAGGGEDRPQRRAGARRPGQGEGRAGEHGAAAAGALHQSVTCHSRESAGMNGASMNSRPMTMITPPEIFSAVGPVSAECSARWPSSPRAMKMNEKLPTKARLGPSTRPRADLPGLAAGDRGDVAGHERQHARRQEGDQPGAERHRKSDSRRCIDHVGSESTRCSLRAA